MSVRVLVIPEDFRRDQYVLRPIVRELMLRVTSTPKVEICTDPLLGGVREALKWERIEEIIQENKWCVDLFLLLVDRDGQEGRKQALGKLESQARELLGPSPKPRLLLAENAWQELEVWVLAGLMDLPRSWSWKEVREHLDPKEAYFDPVSQQRGLNRAPYGGRETLAREAAANYDRIRKLCPELADLEQRIQAAFAR